MSLRSDFPQFLSLEVPETGLQVQDLEIFWENDPLVGWLDNLWHSVQHTPWNHLFKAIKNVTMVRATLMAVWRSLCICEDRQPCPQGCKTQLQLPLCSDMLSSWHLAMCFELPCRQVVPAVHGTSAGTLTEGKYDQDGTQSGRSNGGGMGWVQLL